MYLNITQAAKEKIAAKVATRHVDLLLDFDDGVGPLSPKGACALSTVFRLVIVPKDKYQKDYNAKLDSDMAVIRYKDYSETYMDQEMTLTVDENTQVLQLKGLQNGLLAANLAIVEG